MANNLTNLFQPSTLQQLQQLSGVTAPATQAQAPQTADPGVGVNAELLQMLQRGIDPRTVYPQAQGLIGKEDVFEPEVEEKFTPRVRQFVREVYGPAEIQTRDPEGRDISAAEGNVVTDFFRRMFGSLPTEQEKAQIEEAQKLSARGSGSASEKFLRATDELIRGAPSPAEVRGDIPPTADIPPYLQEMAQKGRRIEIPKTQATVLKRDYGVEQPTPQDQETIERSRIASNSINQLESISPGLAKQTIGPLIAADFNDRFGLTGTADEVTAESLDVRQIQFQGSPSLVFTHPETGKPTLLDPVKLELRDFAEILPELMVVGGDITGMAIGTAAGIPFGPKGKLAGNIIGGSTGAYLGRLYSLKDALRKNDFKRDPRLGGYVKEGYNDENGDPVVIPEAELHARSIPDALLSAGGNVVLRGLFRMGKAVMYGRVGADALKGGLTFKQFEEAVEKYRGTSIEQLGKSEAAPAPLVEEGIVVGPTTREAGGTPGPMSVVLQKRGEDLLEKAQRSAPAERRELEREARQFLEQAQVLRANEAGTPAEAARETLRSEVIKKAEGEAAVSPDMAIDAASGNVASAVARGLPVVETKRAIGELDDLISRNNESIAAIDSILAKGTAASADELGESLAKRSEAIMGAPDGTTGIYGGYNKLAATLKAPSFTKGVPMRPFDISDMTATIDKIQPKAGGLGGGYPSDFLKKWNAMTARMRTKAGEAQGRINLDYGQMKDLIISLRDELGSNGNLSSGQRSNMSKLLEKLQAEQVRGLQIIDEAGAAAGKPTSFAKRQLALDNSLKKMAEIWQRGMTQGLETGTYYRISRKLFGEEASPGFVSSVMSTLKPGKNERELMRNTLLYRYKQRMAGLARGELDAAVEIAGRRVTVGTEKTPLTIKQASQSAHEKFMAENDSWVKTLFKDGEFDKLSREVTTVGKQQAELNQLKKFDEGLRKSPLFQGSLVGINQDLSKVVVNAPEALFDSIYTLPPGQRAAAFQQLQKSFKGLPKADRFIAQENLRGLLFRKLLNPAELAEGGRGEVMDVASISSRATRELKENASVFDATFGKAHRKNLETIFKDLGTLSAERGATAMEDLVGSVTTKRASRIPLAMLKVYVGVLNRKARALNQAQTIQGDYFSRKFREALLDPDKALELVRGRNISEKSKLLVGALGSVLGIEAGEAADAVETFGFDPNRLTGIPESSLAAEALR